MPRNVWTLFFAQALALSATPLMVFAGALASQAFAPSPTLATLPVAAVVIGTALSVYPAATLSLRFGRKTVFLGAMATGIFVALLAMIALQTESFWGFSIAALLMGSVVAVVQQFRFAAMESVNPERMPLAASRLLAAGLISAILGPELVTFGQYFQSNSFSGAFMLLAGLFAVALVTLLLGFHNPEIKGTEKNDSNRGALKQFFHRGFLVAAMSAGIGYGVMSFVMTATPISMHSMQSFSLNDTKLVIQSHILAMFIPSLFAGRLILILGHVRLIALGLLAYAACVVLGIIDNTWLHYWWALILLGVGWNFLFVAGTSLLPKMYSPGQSLQAQGINDAMVFSTQAVGALTSSAVLYTVGWNGLLLLTLPLLGYMAILLTLWVSSGKPQVSPVEKA